MNTNEVSSHINPLRGQARIFPVKMQRFRESRRHLPLCRAAAGDEQYAYWLWQVEYTLSMFAPGSAGAVDWRRLYDQGATAKTAVAVAVMS
ncbi:hypothetical protein OG203_44295 [Nocardia sp. NBC_01499]|uniref:hypothetical protein n=1 Tax=Nocardia sp. NBC_01499 TaxID=2903597 RepID=UPI0038667AB6